MAKNEWTSDVRLTTDPSAAPAAARERDPEEPFFIAVLGDFAGDRSGRPAAEPRLVPFDVDDFDAALRRCAPRWRGRVTTVGGSAEAEIGFAEIDDFHPDRLLRAVPALGALVETRDALADPKTFERAARSLAASVSAPRPSPPAPSPAAASGADILDRILSESAAEATPAAAIDDLQRFLRTVVAPHAVNVDKARQAECVAAVDAALAEGLRSVLHDPSFQALEAAWRALHWLMRRCPERVRLAFVDLPKPALAAAAGDGGEAPLAAHFAERSPALLVGLYDFGPGAGDLALLRRLATAAAAIGAPLVAAATPAMLGLDALSAGLPPAAQLAAGAGGEDAAAWLALRQEPAARGLALTAPRFLLRAPYDPRGDAITAFPFAELPKPDHDRFLWANGAVLVAAALARVFAANGWDADVGGDVLHVEGLPAYFFDDGGEKAMMPCAEVLMTDAQLRAIQDAGLLPLVARRGHDAVALPCLQAVAVPALPLRWR